MKRNKVIPFILTAIVLTSCGSKFYDKVDPDFGATDNHELYEISDTKAYSETYFKMHGRYYLDSQRDVCFFDFSSSGFEVTFNGTALEACLYTTNANSDKNRPYLAVNVDNDYDPEHAIPIQLTNGKHSNCDGFENGFFVHNHVTLVSGLTSGEHTIRVYKRSECLNSKVGVKSISTDGTILPVNAKEFDLKMEFYGDSVTCGYAVESPDYYERFSTRTENSMKTYANYAANALNADVSHISCGGYPMYKSKYSQGCTPDNIPDMVSLASVDYQTTNPHVWDNSKFVPDVIVIALGANDGSLFDWSNPNSEYNQNLLTNYKSSYASFIATLRTLYGSEPLIVVSDEIILLYERYQSIMDEIVSESNDPNLIRVHMNAYNEAHDRVLPGEGHPNKEMHQIAGDELATAIRNKLSGN